MIYNEFNPDAECEKCRCTEVGTIYRASWQSTCFRESDQHCPDAEHLHRRCARCGYTWVEAIAGSGGLDQMPYGATKEQAMHMAMVVR